MAKAETPRYVDDGLPLQKFLTYRFSRVQAKLNAQASRLLREVAGLSLTQWRILALVGSHGETSSAALTRTAIFDKGLFSRKLKTLVADGLVEARVDPDDHRVQLLRLSPKGQKVYEDTLPRMRARQRALQDSMEPQEVEVLFRALDKLEIAADRHVFEA